MSVIQPNGLVSQMNTPEPGSPGATVSSTYVYSALGNLLAATMPGPNGHQVVGQVASGIDSALYLSEHKYGMVALSAVGMIPGGAYVKLACVFRSI